MVLKPGQMGELLLVVQRCAHEPRDARTNGRCGFNRASRDREKPDIYFIVK
jgi:hypothetical protein